MPIDHLGWFVPEAARLWAAGLRAGGCEWVVPVRRLRVLMLAPNSTGFAACDSLIRGQILVLGKIAGVAARVRACVRALVSCCCALELDALVGMPPLLSSILHFTNYAFTAIFWLEMSVKLFAYGPSAPV